MVREGEDQVTHGYVIEKHVYDKLNRHIGVMRHWVATEDRALEAIAIAEAQGNIGLTYRRVELDEMPDKVRENMEAEEQRRSASS